MNPTLISPSEWDKRTKDFSAQRKYLAMFSSVTEGITTDVSRMFVPLDDHLVHRGDGIFEALRVIDGEPSDLEAHLSRLEISAKKVYLKIPYSSPEIEKIILKMIEVSQTKSAMIRLFVSRGPGSFSVSPRDSVGSQLYVVLTEFHPMPQKSYEQGVSVMISKYIQKPNFFAQIKSCNYLQNVLVKNEALESEIDFSICLTEDGFISEGPTENICYIKGQTLFVPLFDYTLKGTTLLRAMTEAKKLGLTVIQKNITVDEMHSADEVAMVGTTIEVLPVKTFDGKTLPQVAKQFLKIRQAL